MLKRLLPLVAFAGTLPMQVIPQAPAARTAEVSNNETAVQPQKTSCLEVPNTEGKAWICGHKHRLWFAEPQASCRTEGRLTICERE